MKSMTGCEICGRDTDTIFTLPIEGPGGKHNAIACEACAKKSGVYCLKHNCPHYGFPDGTTTCYDCIEERTRKLSVRHAKKLIARLRKGLPADEFNHLMRRAAIIASLIREPVEACILCEIVSYSLRYNLGYDGVVQKIISERSAEILFPGY